LVNVLFVLLLVGSPDYGLSDKDVRPSLPDEAGKIFMGHYGYSGKQKGIPTDAHFFRRGDNRQQKYKNRPKGSLYSDNFSLFLRFFAFSEDCVRPCGLKSSR
jgi:hypothetical protein